MTTNSEASNNQKGGQVSIVEQVQNELRKSKRDALKKALRDKIEDHLKAQETLRRIEEEISDALIQAGEDASGVAEILGS